MLGWKRAFAGFWGCLAYTTEGCIFAGLKKALPNASSTEGGAFAGLALPVGISD